MPKLTTEQARFLQRYMELAEEATRLTFDKFILAAPKPGELSNTFRWEAEGLMYNDLLRRELAMVLGMLQDETHPCTLDKARDHYTAEILRWRPEHSTNPMANLEAETRLRMHQEMRDIMTGVRD